MLRCLWLIVVLLIAVPAGAVTVKRGPGSGVGGGGASMVAFCDGTQKGVGLDATTSKYDKVCANYNWSNDPSVTFTGTSECVRNTITCSAAFGNGGEDNSCLYAGQKLTTSCVASDYWYAWDNVRKPGGEIWMPAGTYEINGCGDSGGATAACPVVYQDAANIEHRPGYDFHTISLGVGGVSFHGAGQDSNGMRDGRLDGTVFLNDTGEIAVGTDAYDGTVISLNTIHTGLFSGPNSCGTAVLDAGCDFDRAIALRSFPGQTWGASLDLMEDVDYRNAALTNPMRICVANSVVTNGGFCSHDKRETCTGANQAAADAVCAAVATGATCLDQGAALLDELTEGCAGGTNCNDVDLVMSWKRGDRFNDEIATNQESAILRIYNVTAGGCGGGTGDIVRVSVKDLGGTVSTRWGLGMAERRLDISANTGEALNVLHPFFYGAKNQCAGQNFTVMPSSWWGRDDDGDAASGADADCVDGNSAGVSDETECDTASLLRMGYQQHAGLCDVSFLYGSGTSNSVLDGGKEYYDQIMRGITVAYGARGQISDSGRTHWYDSEFRDNTTSFALITVLNSGTRYENMRFMRNSARAAISCKQASNATVIKDITFEGNWFNDGMLGLGNCGIGTMVRDIVGKGNAGRFAMISGEGTFPPMGLTFSGINLAGQILPNERMTDFPGDAFAAFFISDINSVAGVTEFNGIKIEDVHISTPVGDAALVYLEDDGVGDQASDWGRYLSVYNSTLFTQSGPEAGCTADKEPWACCTAASTGATCQQPKLVVIGDGSTGEDQASEAKDILLAVNDGTITNPPRLEGNRLFWLNSTDNAIVEPVTPDWPYTCRLAAETPDCDDLPHGAEVCITDDEVRGQCAATAGQLDGLGVTPEVSVCVCDGAGTFTSSP